MRAIRWTHKSASGLLRGTTAKPKASAVTSGRVRRSGGTLGRSTVPDTCRVDGEIVTFRIQKLLTSPNRNPHGHWSTSQRERQEWQRRLTDAVTVAGVTTRLRLHGIYLRCVKSAGWRMRVTVTRIVPSKRNFIRDDDNLLFSTKRLRDALKRNGLIHDDARTWLEMPMPTQEVSADGAAWTVITIQPAGLGTGEPRA